MSDPGQTDPAITDPAAFSRVDVKSAKIIGAMVVNRLNEDVGNVEDVVIDALNGRIVYAVLSFGASLAWAKNSTPYHGKLALRQGNVSLCAHVNRDQIALAPSFDNETWPQFTDDGTGWFISFTNLCQSGLHSAPGAPLLKVTRKLDFRGSRLFLQIRCRRTRCHQN